MSGVLILVQIKDSVLGLYSQKVAKDFLGFTLQMKIDKIFSRTPSESMALVMTTIVLSIVPMGFPMDLSNVLPFSSQNPSGGKK